MPNGNVEFGYPEYGVEVHKAFPKFEVVTRLTDSLNDLTGRAHPNPESQNESYYSELKILNAATRLNLSPGWQWFCLGAMKIARTVMKLPSMLST